VAIELAVALSVIATKAVVGELIQGGPMTRETWAGAAKQVVDALVNHTSHQDVGFGRIGNQIDRIGNQIDDIPVREFGQHMAAGRRHLRDLPVAWRTEKDRRDLIHDARTEFVSAVGIAENMKDAQRQALAEVAIAGCWLWVGSLPDVQNTIGEARQILEQDVLWGTQIAEWRFRRTPLSWDAVAAYADVLTLGKAYGERPAMTAVPIVSRRRWTPAPDAGVAVWAVADQWVECAGIEVKIGQLRREPRPTVTRFRFGLSFGMDYLHPVEVRNTGNDSISVSLRGSVRATVAGASVDVVDVEARSSASFTLSGGAGDPDNTRWEAIPALRSSSARLEAAPENAISVCIRRRINFSSTSIKFLVPTPKSLPPSFPKTGC
jgi:hypothetical protein